VALARDPLSVRYDPVAEWAVMRAIRASRSGRGVVLWIASPRGDFRRLDQGGRTADERAFTRAAYNLVTHQPVRRMKYGEGPGPQWSLKLVWGMARQPSGAGRDARAVRVRVWPRSQARVRRGTSWLEGEGFGRSEPDRRIDTGRRAG
jgi:hypothetical protein